MEIITNNNRYGFNNYLGMFIQTALILYLLGIGGVVQVDLPITNNGILLDPSTQQNVI